MTPDEHAKFCLTHGNKYPYDAPDAWWRASGGNPPAAIDWAHAAARGVLADLTDRRGVKHELGRCDEETRVEITHSLANIIREAIKKAPAVEDRGQGGQETTTKNEPSV